MKANVKYIAMLVGPDGKKYYDAYGPMVTQKRKATKFVSMDVAERAALNRFGRGKQGFWDDELLHESNARKQYASWTYSIAQAKGATT